MSKLIVSEIESTGTTVQINDDLKVGSTGTNAITSGNVVSPSEDMIKFFKAYETPVTAFDAAITGGVPGNSNAIPWEDAASGFTSTTALAVTSTGNSLLTNFSADAVFLYKSSGTANCKNDYWGITIDIPKVYRGQNIILNFDYRTENASTVETAADQWFIAVQDKTNTVKTTVTNTALVSAGAAVTVASKTGLVVGDKIWLEGGGNAQGSVSNGITQTYITSISGTANEITLSQDYTPASTAGSIAVVGYLSDTLDLLASADSDTNKIGKNRKLAFKTAEDTAQVNVWFQLRNTDSVVYSLFMDNIYISANKFLQASSQGKSEFVYFSGYSGLGTGTAAYYILFKTEEANTASNLIEVQSTSFTKFTALEDATWEIGAGGIRTSGASNLMISVYNSADVLLFERAANSNGSTGIYGAVEMSVTVSKSDYAICSANGDFLQDNVKANFSVLATPTTNDVIILESQDEIFTDWVDYTPTFENFGTPTNVAFKYKRVGDSIKVRGFFTPASVTTAIATVSLPSGLSMDVGKMGASAQWGMGSYHGLNDTNLLTDSNRSGMIVWNSSTPTKICFSTAAANDTSFLVCNTNQVCGGGESIFIVTTEIPIAGWNANFNPLLSMPLVEIGANVEQGWWTGVNGASLGVQYGTTSTYVPVYATEEYNSISNLGTVANTAADGWSFTANQRVKVNANVLGFFTGAGWVLGWVLNGSSGATSVSTMAEDQVLNYDTAAANNHGVQATAFLIMEGGDVLRPQTDRGAANSSGKWKLQLTVEKDFSNTNMAHIIKPAVAILSDHQAYNQLGGGSTAGFNDRTLNTVEGESWFVTLSSNQFTLEPGSYKISGQAPTFRVGATHSRLYDVTNGVASILGYSDYTDTTGQTTVHSTFSGYVTIGASTIYKVQSYCQNAYASSGLGNYNSPSTEDSIYTTITIEKLK